MKKRIEKLEGETPEMSYKQRIADLCQQWHDAVWDEDFEAALQARKEAEPLLEHVPEWQDPSPQRSGRYLNKTLFIQWKWFLGYKKTEIREFVSEAVDRSYWPSGLAAEQNKKFNFE